MDNERDILDRASSQRIGGADGELVEELCAEIATLRQELDDADTLREKMGGILSAVAFSLKGPPPTLTMHDWSDLGEVAKATTRELSRLQNICVMAHDRLLRGDEDAEILSILDRAWTARDA